MVPVVWAVPVWLRLTLFVGAGVAGGLLAGKWIADSLPPPPSTWFLLLFFPAAWLAVAAHEFGHSFGGYLEGFRFLIWVAGPIELRRKNQRLVLGWNRSLQLIGGVASSVPVTFEHLPRRMFTLVAGGPVASVLLAVIGSVGYLLADLLKAPTLAWIMIPIIACSMVIGLATLVPVQSAGFASDGARMLMLARGGPEAERWCAIAALAGAGAAGVRPREWDTTLVKVASGLSDASYDDVSGTLIAYYSSLDRGDLQSAGNLIERALDIRSVWPGSLQGVIWAEASWFTAYHRRNASEARRLFKQIATGAVLDRQTRSRALAAILLAEGKTDDAVEEANRGLKAVNSALSPGIATFERESLQEIAGYRTGVA